MPEETREFSIKVLGRTLELLGTQMYKQRGPAIAELVANCWDAGATEVHITIPDDEAYDPASDVIVIRDDGEGMTDDQVQENYLVVGRNRRQEGQADAAVRPAMGRKGIGKLAGLGIAQKATLRTWRNGRLTELTLDMAHLKLDANEVSTVRIPGHLRGIPDGYGTHGTEAELAGLKHITPIAVEQVREALGRRFSRRVRGEMRIFVNGQALREPELGLEHRVPQDALTEETLADGCIVRYYYGFASQVIRSRDLRGFVVYVRGKTAQAPPFFFGVEGTASGQHGTRYVTGAIEADFLDAGADDESDLISTDRQEVDWEAEGAQELREWGETLCRGVLREWVDFRGDRMEERILRDERFVTRIERLDPNSRIQVQSFLRRLGRAETAPDRAEDLADALLRAYEFRHFHDVVGEIEAVGDDPERLAELLARLREWKVLESRAILEIVQGRLAIIDKFKEMVLNRAPETAPRRGDDNLHDLIARYPWLLDPEWQVLSEERYISTQLKEWLEDDVQDEDERLRYDFLALANGGTLLVIDIKRPGKAVEYGEMQRLATYRERLASSSRDVRMVLVHAGTLNVSTAEQEAWEGRRDALILEWEQVCERARRHYEHYGAVLRGDIEAGDFGRAEVEVQQTRRVLERGSTYRTPRERRQGLGRQDANHADEAQNSSD